MCVQVFGCCIVVVLGMQLESELVFVGLQQLCALLLDGLERLLDLQRDVFGMVFGLSGGVRFDCFFVGLVVLSLLLEGVEW